MSSFKQGIVMRFVKFIDAVMITLPFVACWYLFYADRLFRPFFRRGDYVVIALFFLLYIFFGRIYNGFSLAFVQVSDLISSQSLAVLITDVILYIIIWLLTRHLPSVLPLLLALIVQVGFAGLWSVLANRWYFRTHNAKKTIIVYDIKRDMESLISEYGLDKRFAVERTVRAEECCANLKMLDDIDAAFLCGIHSHDRNVLLKYCVAHNIDVYVIPCIGDVIMSGAWRIHMFHLPILCVGSYAPAVEYVLIKRILDIVFSALSLILLSPLMIVLACIIQIYDGGPAFYRQVRLTAGGREFKLIKFRSMRVDAENDGVARLSTGVRDDRVTPVGRFIRKTRMDELPQLFNILKGDMSIVGPRPERPELAAMYSVALPEFSLRLQAKAGLTGYAQVYGKYNTTPYDKLQMDLMYMAHPSIIEDMKIIMATVRILFKPESTDGIKSGTVTAMDKEQLSDEPNRETEAAGKPLD